MVSHLNFSKSHMLSNSSGTTDSAPEVMEVFLKTCFSFKNQFLDLEMAHLQNACPARERPWAQPRVPQ